jgi:hypothetical protein
MQDLFVHGISVLDTELGMYVTCRLVSDVRRGTRRATSACHDVAGMGLPGHLDSQGPDSEVLARTRTSLWYALKRQTGSGAGLQPG